MKAAWKYDLPFSVTTCPAKLADLSGAKVLHRKLLCNQVATVCNVHLWRANDEPISQQRQFVALTNAFQGFSASEEMRRTSVSRLDTYISFLRSWIFNWTVIESFSPCPLDAARKDEWVNGPVNICADGQQLLESITLFTGKRQAPRRRPYTNRLIYPTKRQPAFFYLLNIAFFNSKRKWIRCRIFQCAFYETWTWQSLR